MAKQKRPLDDAEYNKVADRYFSLGKADAFESVGPDLREKAGKLFAAGKDEIAKAVRDIADEYDKMAKTWSQNHVSKFGEREGAWR